MELVSVVVYNRLDTIALWLAAWKQCDKYGCKIAVVHNCDEDIPVNQYYNIIRFAPDFYIKRKNVGMDIGAFQSMINFDWEVMYWFTDDMLPMKKQFLKPFVDKIHQERVGLVGHNYAPKNIRTVAFAIRKEVAEKLILPHVTTREQCLQFEHGYNHLTDQVKNLGYKVKAVHGVEPDVEGYEGPGEEKYSYWMWDWHYFPHLNLWSEYEKEFGSRYNHLLREKLL